MFLALTASLIACGSNNNTTSDAPKTADAAHDAGSGSGSGSAMTSFQITGFANGLYWDSTANALYFTEKVSGSGNAFCKWTDANGIEVLASLDGVGSADPGEIAKLADGSFITPQFSTLTAGANNGIIHISGSTVTLLPEAEGSGSGDIPSNVDAYRSVGLTLGSDGTTIYQSAFVKGAAGYILKTTLAGGSAEQDVVMNGSNAGGTIIVGKVVGLVANADGTFILGDQTNNEFWKVSADGQTMTMFGPSYTKPDLLLQLPNGDMLDGGGAGGSGRTQAINRIALTDGTVTPLTFTGFTFTYVAGMAYDAVNHRLFVDDQTGGSNDTFDILPYNP
jgi:hypothetical protein